MDLRGKWICEVLKGGVGNEDDQNASHICMKSLKINSIFDF